MSNKTRWHSAYVILFELAVLAIIVALAFRTVIWSLDSYMINQGLRQAEKSCLEKNVFAGEGFLFHCTPMNPIDQIQGE